MSMRKIGLLQEKLGYQFSKPELLKTALTHKSAGDDHYEKLEFLGDSILNYCISSIIFKTLHDLDEGKLSILRAKLVSKPTLSKIGKSINIDTYIHSKNQKISDSIRADVMEALIGAIYIDKGIHACEAFVSMYFSDYITSLAHKDLKDPKSHLQELVHQMGKAHPDYQIITQQGKAHDVTYTVQCTVNKHSTQGSSATKRQAEKIAAEKMLKKLQEETNE